MRIGGWRFRIAALALAALGVCAFGGSARAQDIDVVGGRVVPQVTRRALPEPASVGVPAPIAAARALPLAVDAMRRLAASGYVRAPQADAAQVDGSRSFVTLAFTDPGNPAHVPLVLVATDAGTVPPQTRVAGGVFTVDPSTQLVSLAPDVPESDLFVAHAPGLDGAPPGLSPADSEALSLQRWAKCSLVGCGVGVGGCLRIGALIPLPPQARAGCAIAVCALAAYACLW